MHNNTLHIVSLDNPFPPVYGGIIDIFYKIQALHRNGCEIYLHCFVDTVPESNPELEAIVAKVFYYPKTKSIFGILSMTPFSVKTRTSSELSRNLHRIVAPVLFESLKPTAVLSEMTNFPEKKILRMQNIEHDYFNGIAHSETNFFKKALYFAESLKYKNYEPRIKAFDDILSLSVHETDYIRKKFGNATYIPLFHGNDIVAPLSPFGNHAVYNGDLNTADNRRALDFIISVFKEINDYPLVIAVRDRHHFVRKLIGKAENITLAKPDNYNHLKQFLADAHINIMFSYQSTGTKLKLVNALHNSRHCLINENMVDDPEIIKLCTLATDKKGFIAAIQNLRHIAYDDFENRKRVVGEIYDDQKNARKLMDVVNSKK